MWIPIVFFSLVAYAIAGYTTYYTYDAKVNEAYRARRAKWEEDVENWKNDTPSSYMRNDLFWQQANVGRRPQAPDEFNGVVFAFFWPIILVILFIMLFVNKVLAPVGFGLWWLIRTCAKFPDRAGRMISGWLI